MVQSRLFPQFAADIDLAMEASRAGHEAAQGSPKWRSMESAPKDDTEILIWGLMVGGKRAAVGVGMGEDYVIGKWRVRKIERYEPIPEEGGASFRRVVEEKGFWDSVFPIVEAKRWMPLPPPPQE